MIGIDQEITEKRLKKGRKLKNRMMEFSQMKEKQIKEIQWNQDWNEEQEIKQIPRAITEYQREYGKIKTAVEKMNIKTKNYKDRIESKWWCLNKGLLGKQEEKQEYDKEFNRLKKRVDKINQSAFTKERIKLERARITYKMREEEIKRAEILTSRKP